MHLTSNKIYGGIRIKCVFLIYILRHLL